MQSEVIVIFMLWHPFRSLHITTGFMHNHHMKFWNRGCRHGVASYIPAHKRYFEVFPDDVFVVSYPRSGNSWIFSALVQYLQYHFGILEPSRGVYDIYQHRPLPLPSANNPRFLKSHELFREEYPRVIYVIRDGRDVAVSNYYYHKRTHKIELDMNFSAFLQDFVSRGWRHYCTWSTHIQSWHNQKGHNMLLVRYEDLHVNPAFELERILRFSGIEICKSDVDTAVMRSTFAQLQNQEKEISHNTGNTNVCDKRFLFFRSGKTSSWHTHFSEEDFELFMEHHGRTLEQFGYDTVKPLFGTTQKQTVSQ